MINVFKGSRERGGEVLGKGEAIGKDKNVSNIN